MGENFFSVIFYSFYILEGNYQDFKSTIQRYIKLTATDEFILDHQKYVQLHTQGGRELSRLVHNYTAAWYSLVEHTQAIRKKLKKHEKEEIRNFTLEYESKLSESLKENFENLFVKDLRRYVQHKALPVPTLHFRMTRMSFADSASDPPLAEIAYSFEFSRKQIQDFDWNGTVKEYIGNNESIPLEKIIDGHFTVMKEFYRWIQFRDYQLHPYAPSSIKQSTFEEWKQQNGW